MFLIEYIHFVKSNNEIKALLRQEIMFHVGHLNIYTILKNSNFKISHYK